MIDWFIEKVLESGCITEEDFRLFKIVDKPQDVVKIIRDFYRGKKSPRAVCMRK